MNLKSPGKIQISAKVAAYLNEIQDCNYSKLKLDNTIWQQKPFWNIERVRIGNTRTVPIELIVNGEVVATKNINADGNVEDINFDTEIKQSSWVALRVMYSAHTNPIFVILNQKPIRASAKSAQWCLKAVDQCWSQKSSKFSLSEKEDARKVYDNAKEIYQKILLESSK